MTYDMFRNGQCPGGFKRYKWASLGRTWASQSSVAIDELGRLFTWGQNWDGKSGQGNSEYISPQNFNKPHLLYIELATQLNIPGKFIESSSGELSTMALNSAGEIWGWGVVEGDSLNNCAAFGLPHNSGEWLRGWMGDFTGSGTYFYEPVRCAPGFFAKKIAHCYYYTLAIGLDDKLYVWGDRDGLGVGVSTGGHIDYPIIHPLLTDDIKLIDCELFASAIVTTDNRVFICGDWWWWFPSLYEPTEITGLPSGANIVQIATCIMGVVALLDNGEVWAAGDSFMFLDGSGAYAYHPETFQQVTVFADKFIKKVVFTNLGANAFHVLDDKGTIWGYEESYTLPPFTGNNIPIVYDEPNLVGMSTPEERRYVDFISNPHQSVVLQAIDEFGFLWTWGTNWWGPHMASGGNWSARSDEYEEVHVHRIQVSPGMAAPAIASNGELALLNIIGEGIDPYQSPIPQIEDHEPCGYWYRKLWDAEEEWPRNCFMPSIGARDNKVMFIASARYFPFTRIAIEYDISSGVWERLLEDELKYSAGGPGGVAIHNDAYAFANIQYNVSGTRFNEVYSAAYFGVVVSDNSGEIRYTEFPDVLTAPMTFGQNKVGINSSGLVAVAYTNASAELVVKVSTNFGATWTLRRTIAANSARKDYSLLITSAGHIYLAYQTLSSRIEIERSTDNGVNWTTQVAGYYVGIETIGIKLEEENDNFILITEDVTGVRLRTSINECVNFQTISGYISSIAGGSAIATGHYIPDNISFAYVHKTLPEIYRLGYSDYAGAYINEVVYERERIQSGFASMAGTNGQFFYSAMYFHVEERRGIIILMSRDRGAHWSILETPLRYYEDWSDVAAGDINPLWPFNAQRNKIFKYDISNNDPRYRGGEF